MTFITISAAIAALLVVTSTSTVYSVLWLVSTFIIISALLGLLNLGFPALLYIIVYVGAIAILFLFVVQLLDLGLEQSSNALEDKSVKVQVNSFSKFVKANPGTSIPMVILVSLALLSIFVIASNVGENNTNIFGILDSLIYGGSDVSVVVDSGAQGIVYSVLSSIKGGSPQVLSIAEWFYGPGLLPLIVVSIILLVAMIAPISLCKE